MNLNLPIILANSVRILSIANKAIPLIKEANPIIKGIKEKVNTIQTKNSKTYKDTNYNTKEITYVEKKPIEYHNNTLTFFQ